MHRTSHRSATEARVYVALARDSGVRAIGFFVVLAVTGLSFAPDPARADGLIQSLPADGAWVRYNFRCRMERGGSQKELIGDLTIKSAGAVQHDGRPHRWIETVLDYRESTGGGERREIEKLLFPESELDGKGSPKSHLVRGWEKDDDQDIRAINVSVGPDDDLWFRARPSGRAGLRPSCRSNTSCGQRTAYPSESARPSTRFAFALGTSSSVRTTTNSKSMASALALSRSCQSRTELPEGRFPND
jgi:hypothetical protein